ncbi:hypothetical protein HDU93_004160 [Gonapodya sp. JEL0774]|nr:hypothetical protein HDU93_004160 [Gonapodya sp. JEL0774]
MDASSSPAGSGPTSDPEKKSRNDSIWSLSLRTLIVLLVAVNISSVALVTVILGVNTNNKSIGSATDQGSPIPSSFVRNRFYLTELKHSNLRIHSKHLKALDPSDWRVLRMQAKRFRQL